MARERRGPSGYVFWIRASAVGEAMAPPTPWATRAAINQSWVVANPPSNEAAVKNEAPEGEGVGRDHPLEARSGEMELVLDRRQGDVHDGPVEDHHHLDRADQQERQSRVLVLGQSLIRTIVTHQ